MADISNLIGKLNNSNEEVIDQLGENNEHVSRTNNLIQNLTKVLTGNDLQEAEDKRELNSLLKKLSEGKGDGKSVPSAGKVTPDGGLLSGLLGAGIIGTIVSILGAKSPLGLAVKMLKESKIAKTFVSIFKRLTGFFGKEGGGKKLLGTIKSAKGPFLKGLKFLGRIFGRIFAIFTVITAYRNAKKVFDETEGDFSIRLGKALGEFGASILDALFGWIPTLTGHVLEFFGAPKWLTEPLKEFDLKQEILDLVDKVSAGLEEAILFFMDGSFTAIFTEQIPEAIEEFFSDLGDWFKVNVTDPVTKFIDNNETIQKIKEKSDNLVKMLKAIPDKVNKFIDKISSGFKSFKEFTGLSEIDGSPLPFPKKDEPEQPLPNNPKAQAPLKESFGLNIEPGLFRRNLGLPPIPPQVPVIVPVPAAGPSGTEGGTGTTINVNNGVDSSIRDAQNRALQGGPPSMFQFFPIPQ